MAQLFVMPQPGSTMEEGTIIRWHKNEGDAIREGETLLEIETDKATVEVEATVTGIVRRLLAKENEVVPVRQPIAILGDAHEPIDDLLAQVGLAEKSVAVPTSKNVVASTGSAATGAKVGAVTGAKTAPSDPVYLSPRAQRLAAEHGITAMALAGRGTGPEGRVIERDVLAFLETKPLIEEAIMRPAPRSTPLAARIADDLGVNLDDLATGLPGSRVRRDDVLRHAESGSAEKQKSEAAVPNTQHLTPNTLPFSGMRKRIADNVTKSAFTAPHVTLTLEADMTACAEFRQKLLPEIEKAYGVKLSYTDILVKAVARALDEHPRLNASLIGEEIHLHSAKNIGVAVALEEGLIVPVVKNAESKSLGAISAELKPLIERARTGKFTPEDISGGTFSITNLGAFGIDVFDPIIVTGQAAILGVGRIAEKPVVKNKEVVIRSMMNLCLSFDHRLLDGAPAARFLQRLQALLESPLLILI